MIRHLLLPLSLTGLVACSHQNTDADALETGSLELADPVAEHSAELSWIAERGVRMFQLDRAAALATDAVLAAQGDEHPGAVVRGWIVVPDGDAFLVRFLAEHEDGGLGALFDVQVGDSEPTVQLNRNLLDLSAEESALALATRSAPGVAERVCSDRYNTITLRDEPSGEIHVYLVPATVEPGVVFVAGFDRVRFSADGSEVLAYEPLSESCLAANITPDAAALAVALPNAELPDETHVFNSMNSNEIIAVVIRLGVWIVVADTIMYRAQDAETSSPVQRPCPGRLEPLREMKAIVRTPRHPRLLGIFATLAIASSCHRAELDDVESCSVTEPLEPPTSSMGSPTPLSFAATGESTAAEASKPPFVGRQVMRNEHGWRYDETEEFSELISSVLEFATNALNRDREFYPFAFANQMDQPMTMLMAHDGRERPPVDENLALLRHGLVDGATAGTFTSSALAYDTRLPSARPGEPADAIAIALDHRSGASWLFLYQYSFVDGHVVLAQPILQPRPDPVWPLSSAVSGE